MFTHTVMNMFLLTKKQADSDHSTEPSCTLFFNLPLTTQIMTADELKLRDEIHNRSINFIKTGDPNNGLKTPSNVNWQKYDSKDKNMMVFDSTVKCGEMPEKENMDFMKELFFGAERIYGDYRNPIIFSIRNKK